MVMKCMLTNTKAGLDTSEGAGRGTTPETPEPKKEQLGDTWQTLVHQGPLACIRQCWVPSDAEEKQSFPPTPSSEGH